MLFFYLQVYHDLSDAAQNGDEVKNVPRVSKVVLLKQESCSESFPNTC